jgi:hypothetical protein
MKKTRIPGEESQDDREQQTAADNQEPRAALPLTVPTDTVKQKKQNIDPSLVFDTPDPNRAIRSAKPANRNPGML